MVPVQHRNDPPSRIFLLIFTHDNAIVLQLQRWAPTLIQPSHNVAWMLSQCWSLMLGSDVSKMFTQCCLIIVSTLAPTIGSDVATTFTLHCFNIVWMVANVNHRCGNIVAMLGFLSEYNIAAMFTQCCLDVHKMLLGCLKASTNNRCHNFVDRRWDNIGTNIVTMVPQCWTISWVSHFWLIAKPFTNRVNSTGSFAVALWIHHSFQIRLT